MVHPWVTYRKAQRFSPEDSALRNGTIFFPVHGAGGTLTLGIDDLGSVTFLSGLATDFHPIRVCVFFGDLNTERVKSFTDAGFEVCTLGDPSAPEFVDNFYSLIGNCKLLVSEDYGSQVPLATEFGIPVQILGRKITAINLETNEIEDGFGVAEYEKNISQVYDLFARSYSEVQSEQRDWAEKILGLEFEGETTKIRKTLLLKYMYLLFYFLIFDFLARNFQAVWRALR